MWIYEHNKLKCYRRHILGNLVNIISPAFLVFVWATFGLYTSFFHGTIPFIPWHTPHTVIFGLVWLFFVFPGAIYQARTVRNCFLAVGIGNHGWSLLPLAIANLIIQVLGIVVIPLAWFPSYLPGPLANVKGGVLTGIITLVVVFLVLTPCNFALIGYMKWLFREPTR